MIITKGKLVYSLLPFLVLSLPVWGHNISIHHAPIPILQEQQITVHGTVSDATSGDPLPGVTVAVKGTSRGTTTDANGKFTLNDVAENGGLVVSFIGYETQEVKVNNRTAISIRLHPSNTSLNEVVVVGYGTEKKMNLTGAVDQVSGKVLENRPMPNTMRGLEGVLPGVYINMPTGSPTQSYTPVIRGAGSIGAGGSALVLIDGVPGDLSTLNPDDIQSISVLKDASAAAIYGARGAFGVILVTTKSAKEGKTQITYSGSYSLNDRAVKPKLLTNGYLWAENFNNAYYAYGHAYPTTINTGLTFSQDYLAELKKLNDAKELPKIGVDPSTGKYIYYGSSDWQKLLYADYNPSMQHALSISGGTKKIDYYLSGRYYYQKGIFRYSPDTYKQYNMRAKGSVQVFPWLKVGNDFSFSQRSYYYPESAHNSETMILRRISDEFSPLAFLKNPDGTFTKNAVITFASFLPGGSYEKYLWNQFSNIFNFTASFFNDNLKIYGNFSYISSPYLEDAQRTPLTYSQVPGQLLVNESSNDWASETTQRNTDISTNIYASYERSVGKSSFKGLLGYNYESTNQIARYYQRYGLLNSLLPDPSLITGQNFTLTGGGYQWTTLGEFFRFNYNYADKYLVEINGRYDGSSKFPLDQQFGFFPSISAGWRISQEKFWKVSPKFISNLKLRASLGSLGNGDVAPYSFLATMPVSTLGRVIGGTDPLYTNNPNVIPDGLTWEKVTTANAGADIGFLDDRLNVTFDKYIRYTTNMFTVGLPLPGVFGAGVPKGNYANLRTPGWELSIDWHDQVGTTNPFRYEIKFDLSDNYSIVTKYNNPQGLINTYYKGERLGAIWGYVTDGLYQNAAEIAKAPDQSMVAPTTKNKHDLEPGDVRFVDRNGDGKITPGAGTLKDPGDMTVIGNNQPRYLFGFTGNAEWQHFTFSMFFQGIGKRDWWPGTDDNFFWGQYNRPYSLEPMDVYNNQWSPQNPNAYFPRLVGYTANGTSGKELNVPSTGYLQNAAYIRLKSLTIGYNLPKSLISRIKINEARIYFTGQNLWVWSPMFKVTKALDPEAIESQADVNSNVYLIKNTNGSSQNSNGVYNELGTSGDVYPILKSFTLGINLTF